MEVDVDKVCGELPVRKKQSIKIRQSRWFNKWKKVHERVALPLFFIIYQSSTIKNFQPVLTRLVLKFEYLIWRIFIFLQLLDVCLFIYWLLLTVYCEFALYIGLITAFNSDNKRFLYYYLMISSSATAGNRPTFNCRKVNKF